jgi:hypothetical protein
MSAAAAHLIEQCDAYHPDGALVDVGDAMMFSRHTCQSAAAPAPRGVPRDTPPTVPAQVKRVVEGRPPSTVNVPADDGSTCRYCLAEWAQSDPSAVYTFLYRV